jgi:acyl-coenzyme A thioesterase PaaI-like protein
LFQGYDGLLHGGVIAAVLDSAMTNCLFAHGIVAVTGELTVRFLHPVLLTHEAVVKANIKESFPPLHCMEARLMQNGRIVARASARFMERAT